MCLVQLEEGIDSLYRSFNGLDARVSGVGQTAANIGEHLQVDKNSFAVFWSSKTVFFWIPCKLKLSFGSELTLKIIYR